ncbi:hypothetical protein FFLO_03476 [Filobasidium floriforme]|uniref:Major facilitator superfamily (MFS) profile domain-containing protein n=1 Tax=Filobasidium floriforme TaxID=5210 RepID=A0A8K0JKM6_9TREE|nr:hypothetical protein FFLO_03476 [Filobasidium floriforme]
MSLSEKSTSSSPTRPPYSDNTPLPVTPVPYNSGETHSVTISDAERTVRSSSMDAERAGTETLAEAVAGGEDKKMDLDPNECRFEGEDDPDDPLNIPFWKKWIAVITVGTGAICVTCTSSMASSTYAGIEREFGISQEVAILSVSLFVLGLGSGPLLLGPVSEFVGRRKVYLASYLVFLLFNIPVALANNIAVHLIFRFITGFAGSAFLSISGGTVSDMFINSEVGPPMAFIAFCPFSGPVLGPLIAGFINQNTYWRWTYYLVLIWAGVELLLVWFFVPESYRPQVLRLKAKRERKAQNNPEIYAPIEKSNKSFLQAVAISCKTPFKIMATEMMALLLSLWTALLLGILYLFFNAIPLVFRGNHGFSLQQSGLAFLGIGLGQVIAAASTPFWSRVYQRESAKNGGKAPPEARLLMGMAGALVTPIGMFIFTFTTYKSVPWIIPILGTVFFGMGIVWVFTSVFTYLVDAYRPVSASAMACNSALRSSFAAGFPLFSNQMYHRLGTVGASGLLAGLTVLMVPLPFVFYRIGARVRSKSKFGSA